MTPEEFEHHVAGVLRNEGWSTQVSRYTHDYGLDIVAERTGIRLGVQVKMYGLARKVNAAQIRELVGAAQYADCERAMIVTDGELLDDARRTAEKLGVEVRFVRVPRDETVAPARMAAERSSSTGEWTFGRVWKEHVIPLEGKAVRTTAHGLRNTILRSTRAGSRG